MKKTMTFVIAILAAALLAGACGKKKDPAAPGTGSDMGSAAPAGSDAPAAGSGSAM